MSKRKYHRQNRASGATAFVIKVGVLCCVLILINAVVCQFLCIFLKSIVPGLFDDLRMIQAIMYFGPILLICFEFWLYDRRVDYLASLENKKKLAEQETATQDSEAQGVDSLSSATKESIKTKTVATKTATSKATLPKSASTE